MNKDSSTPSQESINLMLSKASQLKIDLPEFKSKFDAIINILNDINYMAFNKTK